MTKQIWTVAEAKSRLSEILQLATTKGPQRIGKRTRYIVVPEGEWTKLTEARGSMGTWLVHNLPRDGELELPSREEPVREEIFGSDIK